MEELALIELSLKQKATESMICSLADATMENIAAEGDNFASDIYRAKVNVIINNGCKTKKSFIVKKENKGSEIFKPVSIFKTEIMVYEDVLSKCEQLMNEYEDYQDKLWCDLIAYKPFNVVVFEDLKCSNFKSVDRRKFLDSNHVALAVISLARFHAMSHVLLQKRLINKNELSYYMFSYKSPVMTGLLEGGLEQLSQVMDTEWSDEWKEIAKRLSKEKSVVMEKCNKLFEVNDDTFLTVCHGDLWTCNLMFKYSPIEENTPTAMKFIDFQMCHINSYIQDLIFFFYVSVGGKVREENYEHFLRIYQESLAATLAIYGMEGNAPTFEQIYNEANRMEYLAFIYNVIIMPITITEVKNGLILENATLDYSNANPYNPEVFKGDTYRSEIEEPIKRWAKKGLF